MSSGSISNVPTDQQLAVAIVREVRVQEGADPLAPIAPELILNIEERLHAHIVAKVNQAIKVAEKVTQMQADPDFAKTFGMTIHELVS